MENCNKIFAEILEVRNVKIEKVIRLGKRIQSRDRPLLVKIGSEEGRIQILRNSSKLRQSREFIKVYLAKDMTEREREKDKKLRMELKEKREEEDDWYIIKRGKVVKAEGTQKQFQERTKMREENF